MFEEIFLVQLKKYVNKEITVAVGEELFTGKLKSVNTEFLILLESTDQYERETKKRVIILSQISYVQVAEAYYECEA